MRSLFDRWVEERAGPEPGTPAAEIRSRYVAAASANDPTKRWAELEGIVTAARLEGFDEVPAAIERYRSATTANAEQLEPAVKSLTRAIYSLQFRPAVGSRESDLLNAWAAFDVASRLGEMEDAGAFAADLEEAARAADASDVGSAVAAWLREDRKEHEEALRAIGLAVYKAAYRRSPPRPHDSY